MVEFQQWDHDDPVALILRHKGCNLCTDCTISAVVLIGRQRIVDQAHFIFGKQSGQ